MDNNIPRITIDLDKKCQECGKGGAAESGICINCVTKIIQQKPMNSAAGRAVQKRWLENRKPR